MLVCFLNYLLINSAKCLSLYIYKTICTLLAGINIFANKTVVSDAGGRKSLVFHSFLLCPQLFSCLALLICPSGVDMKHNIRGFSSMS